MANDLSDYDVALGEQRLAKRERELQEWADRLARLSVTLEIRQADVAAREADLQRYNQLVDGTDHIIQQRQLRQLRNHAGRLRALARSATKLADAATQRALIAAAALERKKKQ
jgi:hypothetical protein